MAVGVLADHEPGTPREVSCALAVWGALQTAQPHIWFPLPNSLVADAPVSREPQIELHPNDTAAQLVRRYLAEHQASLTAHEIAWVEACASGAAP